MVGPGTEHPLTSASLSSTQTTGSPSTSLLEEEETALTCDCRTLLANGDRLSCDARATWIGLLRCCGYMKPLCDRHKETWVDPLPPLVVECRACKTLFQYNPFAVLERI